MEKERFIENLTEQIKEAQLKLGFVKETIRLYFPVRSLCDLLGLELISGRELAALLKKEFENTVLGKLKFAQCEGDRIEVCISAAGAAYVHEQVPNPPFLEGMIELFQKNHRLTIEEICNFFARFSDCYVCEKMETGMDFDYVFFSRMGNRIHGIIVSKLRWDIRFITDLQKQITV